MEMAVKCRNYWKGARNATACMKGMILLLVRFPIYGGAGYFIKTVTHYYVSGLIQGLVQFDIFNLTRQAFHCILTD